MPDRDPLPNIADSQRTSLVERLLGQIEHLLEENRRQAEQIQQLRDEIAVLKGQKARPKFKPSGMEAQTEPEPEPEPGDDADGCDDLDDEADNDEERPPRKRAGSAKRSKTAQLTIHETRKVEPQEPIPAGSRFKGYRDFVVQDLRIEPYNTRYRLEVWQTPDGERLLGALPRRLEGKHFGAELRRFVLYQHHHCHVTQPLLHEQLREWGIDISVGQIDALLSGGNAAFRAEKDQLLSTGLAVSRHITVDDSGARHQGRNGYVTQISNDWFAWFASTGSKSRINLPHNCSMLATSATPSTRTPCPICAKSVCPQNRCAACRRIPMPRSPESLAGKRISTPWASPASAIGGSAPKGCCSAG